MKGNKLNKRWFLLLLLLVGMFASYFIFFNKDIIEIDLVGTYDYNNEEIKDDIHIKSDGVIIKNVVLNSDLYIDEEVGLGHVELNNVDVNGVVYVYGGGKETIYIIDGKILKLIGYVDGRVMATNDTVIDEVIIKEPGIIIENDDTALDAYPKISIEIEKPNEDDDAVVLNGNFDTVEVSAGVSVEVKERTRIQYFPLNTCSKNECPENYKTRVRVEKNAEIQNVEINNPVDIQGEGNIVNKSYGNNMISDEEEKTSKGEDNYKPQIYDVSMTISNNGDYNISFETNDDGTVYYVVQPRFSAIVNLSAEDIVSGKGANSQAVLNEIGQDSNSIIVASAKSIQIEANSKSSSNGYMGDHSNQRPPAGEDLDFDSTVFYIFKDSDGNYSDIGRIDIEG